jgi:hypothetical protein
MTIDQIKSLDVSQCVSFTEIARDKLPMPGVKKRLDEVLNKQILITDFRIRDSKRRAGTQCLQIQFLMDNDVCVAFTGSTVLADQMEFIKEKLPISTVILKIDKYYSFS